AMGNMPDDELTCPKQINRNPKPSPAMMPSATPPLWAGSSSVAREIRKIAGKAQATPNAVRSGGRSPRPIPAATGSSAEPIADSGATTFIFAPANPRYRNDAPMPPPMPAAAPQKRSAGVGLPGSTNSPAASAVSAEELCPMVAICQGPDLLEKSPPRKSDTP